MKANGVIVLLLGALCVVSQGCSIYRAANAPPPILVEEVIAGKDRNSIISILGMPRSTEASINERTDMHEFISGYDAGGKIRILFYIAGDIFTLGLAELIFWPLEIGALQGDEGRAVVSYDQDNIAKTVLVTKKGGAPWAAGSATQTRSEPVNENENAYDYRHRK